MKVLIIDDHTLFRDGLSSLLTSYQLSVVGACPNTERGIASATELQPDIILLDLRMPERDGLSAITDIKAAAPNAAVVMLTTSADHRDLNEALSLGAAGYLLKDTEPAALVKHLQEILAGQQVVSPQLLEQVSEDQDGAQIADGGFDALTPREREIVDCLAEGQSNKVIARNLGIADGTVKLHVKSILRKLGVHSRVEAAILAVERQRRSH
ncbi:MAG: response regulator transcription factor [Gammaproteobacteria bacterium]|nr:response regulator transcription factor [Gammaproteobacteria bacterium]